MATTNFDPSNKVVVSGPITPSTTDTPLDIRSRVDVLADIADIPAAFVGMLVYCKATGKTYRVTSLKSKTIGSRTIENYNPDGYEEFGGGGASDADSISYDPTAAHTTNNTVGKSLKTVETKIGSTAYSGNANESITDVLKEFKEFKEANSGSKTEPAATTTVDLSTKESAGASFTYDIDNKYVYNSKDTTFYQYSEVVNDETKYYGVFKVIGEDAFIRYTISNYTTFTYENTYTEALLPENAKKEFALGSLAAVKRVNGEGESWKNATINLFCTKQNMALRNRCKNVTLNGTTAWRVLIKSEDGNTIFVYKATSNGNYEHETNITRSSVADFNMLDNYFDEKQVAAYSESNTIANPTQNIFYNLMGTGLTPATITSLDISGIGVTNPNEVTILFKTHATDTCSITASPTQRVLGSTSLAKGQVYVMSILRGIACIVEAPLFALPV